MKGKPPPTMMIDRRAELAQPWRLLAFSALKNHRRADRSLVNIRAGCGLWDFKG